MQLWLLITLFSLSTIAYGATFREFGASGNGVQDDTESIRQAIKSSTPGATLDGEGKAYKVKGSIRVDKDVVIRNAAFMQNSPEDGGEGPNNVRTLFFRGTTNQPLRVVLRDVKVHRGGNRYQGSPNDSAGIWIDNAKNSELTNVEITGNGRGSGLFVANSQNLEIRNIRVHDMTWAPCARQVEGLPWEAVKKSWNSYLVIPTSDCKLGGIERVRIQEQLVGVFVVQSRGVKIINPIIERLYALFSDGREIGYQTDGITVGSDPVDAAGMPVESDMVVRGARITGVWEGLDLAGHPLTKVLVEDALVSDVHAIGIKIANGASNVVVRNSVVVNSGLAGFFISGKNDPSGKYAATHDIQIVNSAAVNTGSNGYWIEQPAVAGFRLLNGQVQDPKRIVVENFTAIDVQPQRTMQFGIHAACRGALLSRGVDSVGHKAESMRTLPSACR